MEYKVTDMSLYPKIEESLTDIGRVVKYSPQIYRNERASLVEKEHQMHTSVHYKKIHSGMRGAKPFNHVVTKGL